MIVTKEEMDDPLREYKELIERACSVVSSWIKQEYRKGRRVKFTVSKLCEALGVTFLSEDALREIVTQIRLAGWTVMRGPLQRTEFDSIMIW